MTKLDYASPPRRNEEPPWPRPSGSVGAAACLLVFPAAPFAGLIFQIGILFTLGGMATFLTLPCAVAGLIQNFRRSGAGLWAASVAINGLAAWYFSWFFFVHGLC